MRLLPVPGKKPRTAWIPPPPEKFQGSRAMAQRLSTSCYRLAPKSILENVQWRMWCLKEAALSMDVQALLREWCRRNPLFWLNTFVWSLDTREGGAGTTTPFVSFDCQDEAFLAIIDAIIPPAGHKQHDLIIEKSRDMGATWLCAMAFLYLWMFHPEKLSFFCMSYKEELVDGGDKSIFGKIDFALDHMPSWLKPNYKRTQLMFENLDTGSELEGASTTARSGVGGRYTAMFFDEYPLVENDRAVFAKTADCSRCRIFNGTHTGTHTQFFEITRMKEEDGVRRLRLHWSQHAIKRRGLYRYNPETCQVDFLDKKHPPPLNYPFIKDGKIRSPWYDAECRRRGNNKQAIAQELDIDPHAAGWQFFESAEIMRLIDEYARPPEAIGIVKAADQGDVPEFAFQDAGHLKLWIKLLPGQRPTKGNYGIGCDIASGVGGRYSTKSCASVVNLDTGQKVAELADGRLRPDQFARTVANLAIFFHGAIVVWENVGPGASFRRTLVEDLGYTRVWVRKKNEKSFMPELTAEPGWYPGRENKLELLESYREAISCGWFCNPSATALEEATNFVYDGNTVAHNLELVDDDPSGAKANHGDMVIADALAWLLCKDAGIDYKRRGGGQLVEVLNPPVGSMAWRDMMEEKEAADDGWGFD